MSTAYPLGVARIGAHDIHCVDEGRGFPLLLIHGLAGDHSAWTPQIAAWSGMHRVIAPDSRGAGRSSQVDEPISTEDMARWMSEAINHAETVVFENSSHFFLMEEPERFMDTMNGWLARHTPRV